LDTQRFPPQSLSNDAVRHWFQFQTGPTSVEENKAVDYFFVEPGLRQTNLGKAAQRLALEGGASSHEDGHRISGYGRGML
jgi:hypothetical protein